MVERGRRRATTEQKSDQAGPGAQKHSHIVSLPLGVQTRPAGLKCSLSPKSVIISSPWQWPTATAADNSTIRQASAGQNDSADQGGSKVIGFSGHCTSKALITQIR